MGNWGPGGWQNDHAADLLSIETDRWAGQLAALLEAPAISWDDLEGPLIYVHLVALAGREAQIAVTLVRHAHHGSSKAIASEWKARYLAAYDQSPGAASAEGLARRAVIEAAFEALLAVASPDDAPAPPAESKARGRSRKR